MMNAQIDPVCGMQVEEKEAAGQAQYQGRTYFFCSSGCKVKFDQDPQRYAPQAATAQQGGNKQS